MTGGVEAAALAALDADALARDAAAALRVPSVTGDERPVLELLAETAAALGLEPDLHAHDLQALRRHPGHPGEEAERTELWGLTATLPGGAPRRICLNGHVDVVGPGSVPWRHGPWSGAIEDGRLYGRGAVDMKARGRRRAARRAPRCARPARRGQAPTVVVQCVSSEEDGGLGTFAELERDAAFDAALIPEPTGFDVVCAQAGALTFRGVVHGRAAHAAHRLEGVSAIDRYVAVHRALADARAARQRRRRAPADARSRAALPAARRPRGGGRVVEPGARPARVRGPPRRRRRRRPGAGARGARGASSPRRSTTATRPPRSAGPAAASRPPRPPPTHPWVALVAGALEDELRPAASGRPACRGARTCATSPPAASRARWPARAGSSSPTRSTSASQLDELVALARGIVRVVARATALI